MAVFFQVEKKYFPKSILGKNLLPNCDPVMVPWKGKVRGMNRLELLRIQYITVKYWTSSVFLVRSWWEVRKWEKVRKFQDYHTDNLSCFFGTFAIRILWYTSDKLSSSFRRSAKCFRLKAGPPSRKRMITSSPSMTTRISAVLISFCFLIPCSITFFVNSSAQIPHRKHFRSSILRRRFSDNIKSGLFQYADLSVSQRTTDCKKFIII